MSPQPRGRLLPLHHGDGGDVVGGDGDHPGSAPPEFPPSNLQLLISVSVFLCLRPPPSGKCRGTIYAVGFRSRRNQGDEDRRHRSHEGEKGVPHAACYRGRMGPRIFLLRLPFSWILGSYVIFLPNIGHRKILGHLDVV